ncbi:hypothetical protein G7068_06830 [Leucobacter viscericola]|uniref:DUF1023 domain-containing protein n=1 Tax=Leucobacter viscericola TaxID=2714935 RepID=A0A6G7XEK6_9MICO|nr:alpha/beta hydrolase [Leucobacter viscericola]QIK62942.1 hypothetical protein G7068_06830 [Leucobacter viscericola]
MIEFDDAAADGAVSVFQNAAIVLRGQAGSRRKAADDACEQFAGPFAKLFGAACLVESEDRARLAGKYEDLATDVIDAKVKAATEKAREQALADWQVREDQRKQDRAADPVGNTYAADAAADKKPSTDVMTPPTLSAAFEVRDRVRENTSKSEKGKTSADPVMLRAFVSTSQGLNNALDGQVSAVENAWARFTGACSWVQFGNVSSVPAFARLLGENRSDVLWAGNLAGQFEKAGGGSLSVSKLNQAAKKVATDISKGKKFQNLFKGDLSAEEVAKAWNALGLDAEAVRELPPELLVKLTDLSGLPAWAQDAASREFLEYALEEPDLAYKLMGFKEDWRQNARGTRINLSADVDLVTFKEQAQAIKDALEQSQKDNPGVPIQLIGLGNHDGVLVAGMSVGDLDTASNLTVNVSGMDSSVSDMFNGNDAAKRLYDDAQKKNRSASFAVVNWIGYKSPSWDEVPSMGRAKSGSDRLASFLNGLHASREELGKQPKQLAVLAHSYGSTTAVEALKKTNFVVDRLVTYGSAGVKNDTKVTDLKVGKFYATSATGDWLANKGWVSTTKSLKPSNIEGVVEFSSEDMVLSDKSKLKATTTHRMNPVSDTKLGYLSASTSSEDAITSIMANGKIDKRTKG